MNQTTGVCTRCGKENCQLTIIDDIDRVCDECLDSAFEQCDICGEYWELGYIEVELTDDGRFVCEYCLEDLSDEVTDK